MKEIKFRAWLPTWEWEEGREILKYEMVYDLVFDEYDFINNILAKIENLEQFVGLRDRKNQEVYEADIVSFYFEDVEINRGRVFWNDKGACFLVSLDEASGLNCYLAGDFEVIGNFHQNPELKGVAE